MHEWLEEARNRLAAATGEAPTRFDLSQSDVDDLLELARLAAHESGERTNAPLAAYLVGVARGRHPERALRALVDELLGQR